MNIRLHSITLLSTVLCTLLITSINVASAAQITIPTSTDGEIDSAGVLGITADTSQASIRTLRSGGSNIHHGAFVFDLSSIPSTATINSVDFVVTTAGLISNTSDSATVEFYGFASDATIDTSDFGSPGTLFASETFPAGAGSSPPIGTELSISLSTDAFQALVDAGQDYMTIRSETVNFVTFHVHSLENTIGATPPSLIVNAEVIPEPSALHLLLPLVGLLGWRRRRSSRSN